MQTGMCRLKSAALQSAALQSEDAGQGYQVGSDEASAYMP
jgi:hypothetical protein